jgi:hypothetical protein
MILPLRLLFLLIACALPVADAQDDPFAAGRGEFMAARAAVAALPTEPVGGDPPALRQHPLYPYLVAARISRQLGLTMPAGSVAADNELPIDDAIAAFLAQ